MKKEKVNVYHKSSVEVTLANRPRYNAFQTGHGVFESKRNPKRAKRRAAERRQIRDAF